MRSPFICQVALVLCLAAPSARAQERATTMVSTAPTGDVRSFELTPIAPPTPALKYQFLFDPIDQIPGNAALDYHRATIALSSSQIADSINKAMEADEAGNAAAFNASAASLFGNQPDNNTFLRILDLGGRREQCEWQPAIREMGAAAILPELNVMRVLTNIVYIRAKMQIQSGDVEHAVVTLRLGYALSKNVGREPIVVSGLVSAGMVSLLNETLAQAMSRPESPDLYWALASMPRPWSNISHMMSGERTWIFGTAPLLRQARAGDLTAEQWQGVFQQLQELANPNVRPTTRSANAEGQRQWEQDQARSLVRARQYYAQSRRLPADQVNQIEAVKILGVYFFDRYQGLLDEYSKVVEFSYPRITAKYGELSQRISQIIQEEPGDPFIYMAPSLNRVPATLARMERQLAALTTVEAIRSYAAVHGKQLPTYLADIVDTPAFNNPMTGQPFEYHVEGGVATLADSQTSDYPLRYLVRIR